jgi:hypothetical protein
MRQSSHLVGFSVQDSNQQQRVGAQDSRNAACNERPVYTVFLTGFQSGILRGARSVQIRTSFIKRNVNFENSKELKSQSEKF